MQSTLLIAPSASWVDGVDMFSGTGVLVLDDLLMAGLAGVYFRRLLVKAAVHPALRVEYERKRAAYLRVALAELELPEGVVVVGTHPSDVDLMEFEQVCAIRMSDAGLQSLSKLVYGDSLMLYVQYMSVLRALEDAVDVWHTVATWREVPLWLLRKYGASGYLPFGILPARQRAMLSELLVGEEDASVWLEDDLRLDIPMRRGFLVADYDYLTVISPKWRDAVVRILGSAPHIEDLFRLPWYLLDSSALNTLCYRTSAMGRPIVSTRGSSLIEFVRARLSSVYTTRELVGTWVGGLLSDDITSVDTVRALGFESILSVGAANIPQSIAGTNFVHVPPEYAWMYEAVLDVKVVPWDGLRHVDGTPRIGDTVDLPWAQTLPLSALFKDAEFSPRYAVSVVQFLHRLHSVAMVDRFLRQLTVHATDIVNDGVTFELFDPGLTPLLPGYNYLFYFLPSVRYHVLDELGVDPTWSALLKYAVNTVGIDEAFSIDQMYAEYARLNVYAGQAAALTIARRVGYDVDGQGPGYCYVCMFRPMFRKRARIALGAYPTLGQLLSRKYRSWCIPRYLDRIHVTCSDVSWHYGVVLHFSVSDRGVSLRFVVRTLRSDNKVARLWLTRAYVGQTLTGTVGKQWFVLAIIGWTLVGATVFALVVWFTYLRCKGRGSRRY